jgi:hypothetical protein
MQRWLQYFSFEPFAAVSRSRGYAGWNRSTIFVRIRISVRLPAKVNKKPVTKYRLHQVAP